MGSALISSGMLGQSIVRDASKTRTVGYADNSFSAVQVTVQQWSGATWNVVGAPDFSIGMTNQFDLEMSPADRGKLVAQTQEFEPLRLFMHWGHEDLSF